MALDDFPRLFEAHYREFSEDLLLWKRLAERHPGPVLELGCGTGRVLRPLALEGVPVEGLDRDAGMLARARANLQAAHVDGVQLHQAELADFSLGKSFSLVLVPCNTLALLALDSLRASLGVIRQHLVPGGALAAELPNPFDLRPTGSDEEDLLDTFVEPETGHPVQVAARHRLRADPARAEIVWVYDELLPDGRVQRTEVPVTYFLHKPAELESLLAATGYAPATFMGDYDGADLEPASPTMVLVAEAC